MSARLDRGETLLVYCLKCPGWTVPADDVEDYYAKAISHERRVHRGIRQAYINWFKWRQRASQKVSETL